MTKRGEPQNIPVEPGKTVTFVTELAPARVVLDTAGGSRIEFISTPNNPGSVLIGDDILSCNVYIEDYEPGPQV